MQQQTKNQKLKPKTKKQKQKTKILCCRDRDNIVVFDYFVHSLYIEMGDISGLL